MSETNRCSGRKTYCLSKWPFLEFAGCDFKMDCKKKHYSNIWSIFNSGTKPNIVELIRMSDGNMCCSNFKKIEIEGSKNTFEIEFCAHKKK